MERTEIAYIRSMLTCR
uniref:Uncharacterized protein n=1 Tax=Arundo donax TaxID=35708 RepID=A0A0A8YLR9_ARUDO